ncbi:MAG: HNH endonuclease [Nitrospiria bacterium]
MTSLIKACDTPIKRHVKIKADANPFDPKWEEYFEERFQIKMSNSLEGNEKMHQLWMDQKGTCPICHENISEKTKWHIHHILWKSQGGKDMQSNLVMVHPNCHSQIHSQKLKVAKPIPVRKDRN